MDTGLVSILTVGQNYNLSDTEVSRLRSFSTVESGDGSAVVPGVPSNPVREAAKNNLRDPLETLDNWRGNLPSRLYASTSAAGTSGVIYLGFGLQLYAGERVTQLKGFIGSTPVGTPTNQWFLLVDRSRNVLAKTNDDLATAWGANTGKPLDIATDGANNAISSGYVSPIDQVVYIGQMIKATTMPTAVKSGITTAVDTEATIIGTSADTGQTTPALCPPVLAAGTVQNPVYMRALVS